MARAQFDELVAADPFPLDLAAAWLAAEEDGSDPQVAVAALDDIADRVRVRVGASAIDGVARLHHALFQELGFAGERERYHDPWCSLLGQVLGRRRGLPILLGLVYCEVGRRCGVPADGIGFPGHFLVSPRGIEPRFYVDPFHGGRVLRRDDLRAMLARLEQVDPSDVRERDLDRRAAPSTPRQILVRINNNLKAAYTRHGQLAGVLRAIERLQILAPGVAQHERDRGTVLAELGRLDEAIDAWASYLALRPDAPDAQRVALRMAVVLGKAVG